MTIDPRVTRARAILLSSPSLKFSPPGDKEVLAALTEAAEVWRAEGRYLNAGFTMSEAVHAAWGDGAEVDRCVSQALEDYQACISNESPDSHEAIAALTKLLSELRGLFSGSLQVTALMRQYERELAQRLVGIAQSSPHCCLYLVNGVTVSGDFERRWMPVLPGEPFSASLAPPTAVSVTTSFGSNSEGFVHGNTWIRLPSVFSILLRTGDYRSAYAIIEQCPGSFQTISMVGWSPALRGLLRLTDSSLAFEEAAELFDADKPPASSEDLAQRGGSWSGANQLIWAKYFRALAGLEKAKANPPRAREFVADASRALEGTESGLVNPQVARLRLVVRALAGVLGVEPSISLDRVKKDLALQARIFGEEETDAFGIQFFEKTERALERFERSPASALSEGDLEDVLTALERLPLVGPDLARAVRPSLGEAALKAILGPERAWIHRKLEAITDEAKLRRLILRLLQAAIPRYAQIRHGPIEYGKDVVVVVDHDGKRIVRMYQAKAGDITTPVWRTASHELEEMFLVPLGNLQIGSDVDVREGVLVCNGHANNHVEPIIGPWIEEQARAYGRVFRFMHLDDLVNWIVQDGLVGEFRAIVAELGL
jgi:hypothetical protein